ncbi:tetraacyldisaccharide 4'-kinase [Flavobacterium salilacus subsp. salilacus]|uniref:tetraacyldisaccharide 4'-kinase n=1 Tax=Flavobacterium TaxID=237 RepID=UPI001075669A|nr:MULTISPECIES: tetraacyldisaccharide 4'-kinase [Flavobacterium]KAF2519409.1 tetraacyldisaccharide 4'-kinase [Flavobacterium salilacus subsp. salilacus]MBE1614699.1 tetraacyldisaccharide 4'-kinase [Flavobacterium sp. SaA2.13]
MKIFRLLLLPFSLLYLFIVSLRNLFYDTGIFKSYTFNVPVIVIGNLSTGGTGKSPQTEYLIRLLSDTYKVATLSRGYKRKSEGYVLADATADAEILGDEPYQFYKKFPHITVAVDADRKNGIEKLLELLPKPQVILLDDAYQHRRVKAGFYIVLTAYGDLYANDYVLPAGNLREGRSGANRADSIIVTKCPRDLSVEERQRIIKKLNPKSGQKVYFSYIAYDDRVYNTTTQMSIESIKAQPKIIVAGIAKPQPFFDYLKQDNDVCLTYPDHHYFTEKELKELETISRNKLIITTEKDYMRLAGKLPDDRLFYLPIKSTFISEGNEFDKTILDYVGKGTTNG